MIQPNEREFDFNDHNFQFIVDLINEKAGIVLGDHKKSMVYSRLVRRLRALDFTNFDQYCQFLSSNEAEAEIENFMNSITTNLTAFFRESHHFDHLKSHLKTLKSKERVRIWSTACSTGQEPYSIAMVMAHVLGKNRYQNAKVLATDIDTEVLKIAKDGEYDMEQIQKIPQDYRKSQTLNPR